MLNNALKKMGKERGRIAIHLLSLLEGILLFFWIMSMSKRDYYTTATKKASKKLSKQFAWLRQYQKLLFL